MRAALPPFAPRPFAGSTLLSRLAVGGMAELFIALRQDDEGARLCVVKKVLPSVSADREFVEMFIDEARITVTLRHPNIVGLTDFGQDEGSYYLGFEYVEGVDLGSLLLTPQGQTALPPREAAYVAAEVARGLDFAHDRKDLRGKPLGIVHRDVSPSNVIVSVDGAARLLDFGIAKAAQKLSQTDAGVRKGKLAYMSPELAKAEGVDRRSDVWALGVVLWELLAGAPLFSFPSDLEVADAVVAGNIPKPSDRAPDVPKALERIVLRALERDVTRRYPTAGAMLADLEAFLGDGAAAAKAKLAQRLDKGFGPALRRRRQKLLRTIRELSLPIPAELSADDGEDGPKLAEPPTRPGLPPSLGRSAASAPAEEGSEPPTRPGLPPSFARSAASAPAEEGSEPPTRPGLPPSLQRATARASLSLESMPAVVVPPPPPPPRPAPPPPPARDLAAAAAAPESAPLRSGPSRRGLLFAVGAAVAVTAGLLLWRVAG